MTPARCAFVSAIVRDFFRATPVDAVVMALAEGPVADIATIAVHGRPRLVSDVPLFVLWTELKGIERLA